MEDQSKNSPIGTYDIIQNDIDKRELTGRYYYRVYNPVSLKKIEVANDAQESLSDAIKKIYQKSGQIQGLSFFENDFDSKNKLMYKQEMMGIAETDKMQFDLSDVFGNKDLPYFIWLEELYNVQNDKAALTEKKILLAKVEIMDKKYPFRNVQIWEKTRIEKVSLRGYNPPAPENIHDLMNELEEYSSSVLEQEPIIKAGLISYQFLTIMPYEKNNEIWNSFLLNAYFREQKIGSDYYIPFARYFLEREEERKMVMIRVRGTGDIKLWLGFFVEIVLTAFERTNEMIMELSEIKRHVATSIQEEKSQAVLMDVVTYMEKNPIFAISDVGHELNISYNTAAKSVNILENENIVKEVSDKQRYRLYVYERYLQEILK
jgi:ribosomal protein S25